MRQCCNVAYSMLSEGKDEDELEALDIQLGMIEDPAEEARLALQKYQESMGMKFADPDAPVSPSDKALGDLPDEYLK